MNRKQKRAQKSSSGSNGGSPLQALFNQGVAFYQAGNLVSAEQICRQVLLIEPQHADGLYLMGIIANDVGRFDIAEELLQKSIKEKTNISVHYALANVLKKQNRQEEALKEFTKVISLQPDHQDALLRAGDCYFETGDEDEAFKYYTRALKIKPHALAYSNAGLILQRRGKFQESIDYSLKAIEIQPGFLQALNNLGVSYSGLRQNGTALEYYNQALALQPDDVDVLNNMAATYVNMGQLDQAIALYQKVLALPNSDQQMFSNLLLAMIYSAYVTPEELARTAKDFGERLADPLLPAKTFKNDRNPERKLRIGYVSGDFREHPVPYFVECMARLRDSAQFETFAYSTNVYADKVTGRLKNLFDHWRDIFNLSDGAAAHRIEEDKIDILIDLAGHAGKSGLLLFALKPAPIQVTWLGFPATTGMRAMDYRITDAYAEPLGMTEHLNVETLWRLPEVFCCYQPHENSPAVVKHPPFEDNGYITFGCFNNFSKVSDTVLNTWAKILDRAPHSRLLLEIAGIDETGFRGHIEQRIVKAGFLLDRVILEAQKRSNQFVLYNKIDIALDPFPCNGGTTSMDTLWMGVPFITLAGKQFVSRMGVSMLSNAGLPELIADSMDEYIEKAVALANDRDRLKTIRGSLRERVAASPLMDQERFVKNMENAYRDMWKKYCLSEDVTVSSAP